MAKLIMSRDKTNDKKKNEFKTFLLQDGVPMEQCWNPETGEYYFACIDPLSDKVEKRDHIKNSDGNKISPLHNDLITKGTVLLPTYPEDYLNFGSLFQRIKVFIHTYVELPEAFENIATHYVIFTWVYDCFDTVPYLRVMGEPKKGKSRFLDVMAPLCYKSMLGVAASSTAALFRVIEMFRGTLIMDEGDFIESDEKAKLTKVLNIGFRSKPPLLTCEQVGKNWVPTSFEVFGPKIIATRRPYKDTALESRCLTQIMTGRTRNDIPLHLGEDFHNEAAHIRDQLLMFRLRHYGKFKIDPKSAVPGLGDRLNQIVMPLLAVVEDPKDKERIRQLLESMQAEEIADKAQSNEATVITALIRLWGEKNGDLTIKEITEKATGIIKENDPDSDFKLSPKRVGNILRTLGFNKTKKEVGYLVVDREDNRSLLSRHCREFGMEPLNNELSELLLSDIANLNVIVESKKT